MKLLWRCCCSVDRFVPASSVQRQYPRTLDLQWLGGQAIYARSKHSCGDEGGDPFYHAPPWQLVRLSTSPLTQGCSPAIRFSRMCVWSCRYDATLAVASRGQRCMTDRDLTPLKVRGNHLGTRKKVALADRCVA